MKIITSSEITSFHYAVDMLKSAFKSVTNDQGDTADARTISEPHDTSDRFSRPLLIPSTMTLCRPDWQEQEQKQSFKKSKEMKETKRGSGRPL